MDAQRHNNKCYSIHRHSSEVAYKHQKLLEREIKGRIVLLHDSVRPHMVGLMQSMLMTLKLKVLAQNCWKGRLSAGIVLLYDNVKPHMAGLTVDADDTEIRSSHVSRVQLGS